MFEHQAKEGARWALQLVGGAAVTTCVSVAGVLFNHHAVLATHTTKLEDVDRRLKSDEDNAAAEHAETRQDIRAGFSEMKAQIQKVQDGQTELNKIVIRQYHPIFQRGEGFDK